VLLLPSETDHRDDRVRFSTILAMTNPIRESIVRLRPASYMGGVP